jgi:hypothetical protein
MTSTPYVDVDELKR